MLWIKKTTKDLGLDEWVLGITGLAAVAIGVLDFVGWLQLSTSQLLQMALVSIGMLMAAVVIQAARQKVGLADLESSLEKSVVGWSDVRCFTKTEFGVEYMAARTLAANDYILHASLSPPIPRWFLASQQFEQAIQEVATSNSVKVRYLVNFQDPARKNRVQRLLSNPDVNRYFVAFIDSESLGVPMINFMIFDGEELVLAIPGFGEADAIIAVKNEEIVSALGQYFDLLWAKATVYDRAEAMAATSSE